MNLKQSKQEPKIQNMDSIKATKALGKTVEGRGIIEKHEPDQ